MLGRDGTDRHMQRAGHIDLQTLAGDEIFLCAGLASHLVDEGDALGLGREQIIVVLRRPCQQATVISASPNMTNAPIYRSSDTLHSGRSRSRPAMFILYFMQNLLLHILHASGRSQKNIIPAKRQLVNSFFRPVFFAIGENDTFFVQ